MSNDDVFGEAPDVEREVKLKVKWPLRPLNFIEWALTCAMGEAEQLVAHRAPAIFIEDNQFKNAAAYEKLYGETLTVFEAIEMQNIILGAVQERYRRQVIVAREAGEDATVADYKAACAAEGIDPKLECIK